jgi:hypothetical protein
MDSEAMTQAIEDLPNGWQLFSNAIFSGAVEADHWDDGDTEDVDVDGDDQEDRALSWAERYAEGAVERAAEDIDQMEGVEPVDRVALDQAERMIRDVALAAWQEVRNDYNFGRKTVRWLDEIAEAVAMSSGIELPPDFGMGRWDIDRASARPNN